MVKNTNRTYTTVQAAAPAKHGISLPLHVLQCAFHQNPTSAADPADYTMETTLSTGNRRAGRFKIVLKYCSCTEVSVLPLRGNWRLGHNSKLAATRVSKQSTDVGKLIHPLNSHTKPDTMQAKQLVSLLQS